MTIPEEGSSYNRYPPSVLIGTAVLFIVTSIGSVGLRFYSRFISRAKLGIDDWITLPVMVICLALSVTQIVATTAGGLGSHLELVDGQLRYPARFYVYEKTRYAYEVIGAFCLGVTKVSVLLFFRRLFPIRVFCIINNILICITLAWCIAYTVATAVRCSPVSTFTDRFETEYNFFCVGDYQLFLLSYTASDLALDITIFLLPVPMVWRLQMPWRQKLAVAGIFLLGSITVASSITRIIVYHWAIYFAKAEPRRWDLDITWNSADLLFWNLAENAVGLLGCSLPSYAPLFKNMLQSRKNKGDVSPPRGAYQKQKTLFTPYTWWSDDQTWIHVNGGPTPSRGFGTTLESIPQHRIMVDREFHIDCTEGTSRENGISRGDR
ncbi:hypothetical protein F5X96DRAFT_622255 [Biscogniauxia mediterranea]|nr:hypothetical protein F5X96DRAFT_622255 [Biscogniauxia mediterranea]